GREQNDASRKRHESYAAFCLLWRLLAVMSNTPKGTRTPVLALRGLCPRPLDDGGGLFGYSGRCARCQGGTGGECDDPVHRVRETAASLPPTPWHWQQRPSQAATAWPERLEKKSGSTQDPASLCQASSFSKTAFACSINSTRRPTNSRGLLKALRKF